VTKSMLVSVPWLALTVGEVGYRLVSGAWPAWPVLLVLCGTAAASSGAIGLARLLDALRVDAEQRSFEAGRLYEVATRSSRPLVELLRPAGSPDALITPWSGRDGWGERRRSHRPGGRGGAPAHGPR
jgi:hypothetical protein